MGLGRIKLNENFAKNYPKRMDMFLDFLSDKDWVVENIGDESHFIIQCSSFEGMDGKPMDSLVLFDDG